MKNIHLIITALFLIHNVNSIAQTLLIEGESFQEKGGWVVDQQAMDQMGSPYLMAHGLGSPVENAHTVFDTKEEGIYHMFVRTWNWNSPWNDKAPGLYRISLNDTLLENTFGDKGNKWNWIDGGEVKLKKGENKLTLIDLTGFNGRCDAIIFSRDEQYFPPNEKEELRAHRKKLLGLPDIPKDAGHYDFVVVGGGIAGTSAAVSAAREGLKVALIQNRPVLGGNNSSEVRVHLQGGIWREPYPKLGDIVKELDTGLRGNAQPAFHYNDQQKIDVVTNEPNIDLYLNYHAFGVEKSDQKIIAVYAKHINNSEELRFEAPLFADCTGDANLGYLAGALFRMGREGKDETGESRAPDKGDKMTMGASVQWYSEERDYVTNFPECPWAVKFNETTVQHTDFGEWNWETGMNRNQVKEIEYIRDYSLRVIYGNWSFLKNNYSRKDQFLLDQLEWVAYIAGKRESRRLLGDVILTQQDIINRHEYDDACVTTTWTIDLHYPDSVNSVHFKGNEFRSVAKHTKIEPYPIPYRTLYSANVNNLFMAGRNISVTHVALGTIRVMRTTGMMGEAIGKAAKVCVSHNCLPRDVYQTYLPEVKRLWSGEDYIKNNTMEE